MQEANQITSPCKRLPAKGGRSSQECGKDRPRVCIAHIGSGRLPHILAASAALSNKPLSLTVKADGRKANIVLEGYIGEWDEVNARKFKQSISDIVASGIADAHIYINSGGGDVFQANEIANEIARFTGTITGEGGAVVASAATYIASKIPNFTMAENGSFMIHKPSGYFAGTADEIEASLKLLRNLQANYVKAYAERTGKTEAQIEAMWSKGDYWMSADEALSQGFISGITGKAEITPELAEELMARGVPNVTATVRPQATQPNQTGNNKNENKVNELQIIALAMGLDVSADQATVTAAIKALQTKAAAYDNLKAEVEASENARKQAEHTANLKRFNDAFTAKVNAKAITEDFRAGFESKFSANPEATITEIEALKPVPNISAQLSGGNTGVSAERKDWKYVDWAEKDNAGLIAMAKTDPESFKALYKGEYNSEPSEALMQAFTKA